MSFIKYICFKIIPIATLFIALSYGIAIIFNTYEITYLTQQDGQLIFNWNDYLTNVSTINILQPFENLGNSFKIIYTPLLNIREIYANGWNLGDNLKAMANIVITTLNIPIWLTDILIAITQCLNKVLGSVLNLIGINTSGNITLFNIFRTFDNMSLIPGISSFGH